MIKLLKQILFILILNNKLKIILNILNRIAYFKLLSGKEIVIFVKDNEILLKIKQPLSICYFGFEKMIFLEILFTICAITNNQFS